MFIFVHHVTHS